MMLQDSETPAVIQTDFVLLSFNGRDVFKEKSKHQMMLCLLRKFSFLIRRNKMKVVLELKTQYGP